MAKTSNQIQVSKEEVRLLAIEIGVRQAARKLGLSEDRVRNWSSRYNWLQASTPHQSTPVTPVATGDVLQNELQSLERETRMSLARSAAKLAHEATEANLGQAGNVHKAAQVAGIVHKWNDEKQNVSFSLNVLNMNMLSEPESD